MQPNLLSGLLNNASTSMKVVQTNAKKKEELAKKELGTLSNVVKTTTAVAKANTPQIVGGFGDKNNPQSLLDLHKTTTGFQPLEFDNLMGVKQSGIPNLGFTDLGTKAVAPEKFKTELDKTEEGRKDNIRSVLKVVENGGVVTKQDIDVLLKPLKTDDEKRKMLDLVGNSGAKIEGIDFNTEQENLMNIGDTGISVNPIKQAGEKILELKDYLKNNPKGADPILKTLIEGVVSQFDPTGGIATKGLMQTDAVNNILPQTDNPITQGALGFAGNTVRGVGQVVEGGAGLVDKGIAGVQSAIEGGPMSQYQTRQTGVGEDVLDIGAGATQTLASIYAMPASLLIGTGIEALPEEGQKAVAETMTGLGGIIAQTPGLKQWMESLPKNRQDEFKAELAGATVGLLMGLKNKGNIIKDPKLFIKENLNPVQIAKNFNENVIGIPSKALDMAVNTVGKVKIPEVNIPKVNIPKSISKPMSDIIDKSIENIQGISKQKKDGISSNPYKSILGDAIETIDNGSAPADLKDLQLQPLRTLLDDVDTKLAEIKSQKGEGGELFNLLRSDPTEIDTNSMVREMGGILKGTDYDLPKFLNRVDQGNLLGTRKILEGKATKATLHDIRKGLDDLINKAKANADSGEYKVLDKMRKIVDGKLKEDPERAKADLEWKKIVSEIDEIEEGITYREQRRKGQLKDNIDNILLNLNKPAKAQLLERLEKYIPGIGDRASMISMIPEITKSYTTIPQTKIGSALFGAAIGGAGGGIPGLIIGSIAGFFGQSGMSVVRQKYIKSAIEGMSDTFKTNVEDIAKRVAKGEKLKEMDKIRLRKIAEDIKSRIPKQDKELQKAVDKIPSSLILKSEGKLESRGYTQRLISPKREIKEINLYSDKNKNVGNINSNNTSTSNLLYSKGVKDKGLSNLKNK